MNINMTTNGLPVSMSQTTAVMAINLTHTVTTLSVCVCVMCVCVCDGVPYRAYRITTPHTDTRVCGVWCVVCGVTYTAV